MQHQAPSYADLPPDVLRGIFDLLLPSAEPQPLLDVAQQWLALQLTCKAWAAALEQAEVAVEACLPPPSSVRWLQQHAAVLRLLPPDWGRYQCPADVADADATADCDRWMLGWVQRRCGLPRGTTLWSRPGDVLDRYSPGVTAYSSSSAQYPGFVELLVDGCTDTPPGAFEDLSIPAGTPLLELASCTNLQELCLDIAEPNFWSSSECQPPFDSEDLPASLRTLRVRGSKIVNEADPAQLPFMLSLPSHCCLDTASFVGYSCPHFSVDPAEAFHEPWRIKALLPHLWRSCRQLEVTAEYLLLAELPAGLEVFEDVYQVGYDEDASDDEAVLVVRNADLSELLRQLAAGLGPATPLRRLTVNLDSHFVLPSGQLICARQLLKPGSVALAAAAGLHVQAWESDTALRVLVTPSQGAPA